MSKYDITQITGVIPALLTFFDEHENVDEKRTRDMIENLIGQDVGGFYLTGSTGQAFTMTMEERMRVVEIVCDQVRGRKPVIVHVGNIGTKMSIELARQAESAGADAISSVPPFYWKFSAENIYHYYRDISESVDIPMVIYNIALAGLMDEKLILKLASLPNVKGLKFTDRAHDEMGHLKTMLGKNFMIYSGCDEMAYSGLRFGADGIIGSFYNVIPDLYKKIYTAERNNHDTEAVRLMKIADEFVFAVLKYDFLGAIYNVIRWRGWDAGYPRRPFKTYREEELIDLKKELKEIREKYQAHELDVFDLG
ncbi:dihydrodipicolinate synthase family protein [Porcincola intestinalis]|jgi:N-acetylneuraminate lyase|uniref:Dihydrodipicolinate synthase family protein n=1 Tax=Porcincola intestinalis TaxID=2606632 RepID=A0A6L5X778_9FIRM|nr:dihydrodipicolinate synthase family protein [Porcincola intestinalis]MSS15243.1 dihydrodipicolinate synthase family protein [Porcincola intestinalis]